MQPRLFVTFLIFMLSSVSFGEDKPNILLILTDDQGWGDVGINGNEVVRTPVIDSLFNKGVSFERFYVSPVCSPTRASLLTGRHSLATGVFSVTRGGEKMPTSEITLAEMLKQSGYRTGLFGKWHNGLQYPHNPMGQGFDTFYGFADGHTTRYYDSLVQHNHRFEPYTGYLPDQLTEEAIQFIDHRSEPFFAYLSFNTPHSPFVLPNNYFEKYKKLGESDLNASIYGMVDNIDWNIGRVLKHLEATKKLDNTIVVFLSDNGPAFPHGHHRFNGDMKGWKGKVDEGGVRVPFVIWWNKHIEGGRTVQQPAQHIDLVPTLAALTGTPPSVLANPIHGLDLSPLITHQTPTREETDLFNERMLYTHHFHNTTRPYQQAIQPGPAAVRSGQWLATLDHDQQWQLYDLHKDPSQKLNLADKRPEKVAKFESAYLNWYKTTTRTYGEYKTLPIQIGHIVAPVTELPAHEASIVEEGLNYFHTSGWAHDWLTSNDKQHGAAQWPIEAINTARYEISALYGTTQAGYEGQITLSLIQDDAPKHVIQLQKLETHVANQVDSTRRYETGEAPEQIWKERPLGTVKLPAGLYNLRLNYHQDEKNQPLFIKALKIKRIAQE